MTQLKAGAIGYILGRTPVVILSNPDKDGMVEFMYLRDSYAIRHNQTSRVNFKRGDKGKAKIICEQAQRPQYAITPEEIYYGNLL